MMMMMMMLFDTLTSSSLGRGFLAASFAVLVTALLELCSLEDVKRMRSTNNGRVLYSSAIRANIFNNLLLGPIAYHMTVRWICAEESQSWDMRVACIVGIVLIEGALYYILHKLFHEVKSLYWIHRYHHKFNTIVTPSAANAVSVAEYLLAYMVPIIMGVFATGADEVSTFWGATIIAISNLFIHTPSLSHLQLNWILVSPSDHLAHHRKNKGHYGAPVLHVDRILSYSNRKKIT